MKKLKCLIVDDEPLALDLVEGYVKRTPFLEFAGRCASAFEAMEILDREEIDLLFLDIQMPDLNGIEFSRTLKNRAPLPDKAPVSSGRRPAVIFTTAFEQYAVEGFRVDALDYLLKPFSYEEFLRAANKAKEWVALTEGLKPQAEAGSPYLFVKSEYKLIRINLDEVLYFEGLKDYVKIHLEGQSRPVLSLMSLKSLEERLPAARFMRVHRSFIVHLDKIEAVERSRLIIGDFSVVVAEQYRDRFHEYLAGKV